MKTLLPGTIAKSKREYWQAHMKSWEESNLKQETYCTQAGIRYSTFVYWRGILLVKELNKDKESFLPIKVKPDKAASIEAAPRAIQVKLLSGHVVYIPTSLDIDVISKLILALGSHHAYTSSWHRNLFKHWRCRYEKID